MCGGCRRTTGVLLPTRRWPVALAAYRLRPGARRQRPDPRSRALSSISGRGPFGDRPRSGLAHVGVISGKSATARMRTSYEQVARELVDAIPLPGEDTLPGDELPPDSPRPPAGAAGCGPLGSRAIANPAGCTHSRAAAKRRLDEELFTDANHAWAAGRSPRTGRARRRDKPYSPPLDPDAGQRERPGSKVVKGLRHGCGYRAPSRTSHIVGQINRGPAAAARRRPKCCSRRRLLALRADGGRTALPSPPNGPPTTPISSFPPDGVGLRPGAAADRRRGRGAVRPAADHFNQSDQRAARRTRRPRGAARHRLEPQLGHRQEGIWTARRVRDRDSGGWRFTTPQHATSSALTSSTAW